jgi:transcriptional regulator with XRE-family HTH domain
MEADVMNIGRKIKDARLAKNMTQEELGKILGVQKSAIAKYETGRVVNIKRSTLKKISDILDINPSELIFNDSEIKKASETGSLEEDMKIISGIVDSLDGKRLDAALEIAKKIAVLDDDEVNALLAVVRSMGKVSL